MVDMVDMVAVVVDGMAVVAEEEDTEAEAEEVTADTEGHARISIRGSRCDGVLRTSQYLSGRGSSLPIQHGFGLQGIPGEDCMYLYDTI